MIDNVELDKNVYTYVKNLNLQSEWWLDLYVALFRWLWEWSENLFYLSSTVDLLKSDPRNNKKIIEHIKLLPEYIWYDLWAKNFLTHFMHYHWGDEFTWYLNLSYANSIKLEEKFKDLDSLIKSIKFDWLEKYNLSENDSSKVNSAFSSVIDSVLKEIKRKMISWEVAYDSIPSVFNSLLVTISENILIKSYDTFSDDLKKKLKYDDLQKIFLNRFKPEWNDLDSFVKLFDKTYWIAIEQSKNNDRIDFVAKNPEMLKVFRNEISTELYSEIWEYYTETDEFDKEAILWIYLENECNKLLSIGKLTKDDIQSCNDYRWLFTLLQEKGKYQWIALAEVENMYEDIVKTITSKENKAELDEKKAKHNRLEEDYNKFSSKIKTEKWRNDFIQSYKSAYYENVVSVIDPQRYQEYKMILNQTLMSNHKDNAYSQPQLSDLNKTDLNKWVLVPNQIEYTDNLTIKNPFRKTQIDEEEIKWYSMKELNVNYIKEFYKYNWFHFDMLMGSSDDFINKLWIDIDSRLSSSDLNNLNKILWKLIINKLDDYLNMNSISFAKRSYLTYIYDRLITDPSNWLKIFFEYLQINWDLLRDLKLFKDPIEKTIDITLLENIKSESDINKFYEKKRLEREYWLTPN